ncbi:FHA domain-containing protein [Calditrichota bacterium LG25]
MKHWTITVRNAKREVLIRYQIDQKQLTIGSGKTTDLRLPGEDVDEINLIVEVKGQKLIVTPAGETPVILNGNILKATEFVKAGDQILLGSYLLSFQQAPGAGKKEQTGPVWEIMLTFSHTGQTERVKTLPGYFCFDEQKRDMYWSPDLHDENRLVKVAIEKGQFVARNLFNKPGILFNGRPLKKEKISEGDTISINGIHCIFSLTQGAPKPKKKSAMRRLYDTTFSYTQLKKEKRINQILIPSLFALFLVFFLFGIHYIQGPNPQELRDQIIKKLSSEEFTRQSMTEKEELLADCVADVSALSEMEPYYQSIIQNLNNLEQQSGFKILSVVIPSKTRESLKHFKQDINTLFLYNTHLNRTYDSFIAYQRAADQFRESPLSSNEQHLKITASQFLSAYRLLDVESQKLLKIADSFSETMDWLKTNANKLSGIEALSGVVLLVNDVSINYQKAVNNINQIQSKFEPFVKDTEEIKSLLIKLEKHRER